MGKDFVNVSKVAMTGKPCSRAYSSTMSPRNGSAAQAGSSMPRFLWPGSRTAHVE